MFKNYLNAFYIESLIFSKLLLKSYLFNRTGTIGVVKRSHSVEQPEMHIENEVFV